MRLDLTIAMPQCPLCDTKVSAINAVAKDCETVENVPGIFAMPSTTIESWTLEPCGCVLPSDLYETCFSFGKVSFFRRQPSSDINT